MTLTNNCFQYEDILEPYLSTAKLLYKALLL